jgi:FtsP/CotA-like multicopper oxidase with cupredoxin domain
MSDLPKYNGSPLKEITNSIEPFSSEGATPIKLTLTLSQDPRDGSFEYGINGVPFWNAKPVPATLGETQLWTIENTTAWSHPIHLHGHFFLVLDQNGDPVRPLEWKDTVDVPFQKEGQPPTTLKLLVRFSNDRPGTWIFHCHILDHADGGLLNAVQLGLPVEDFKPLSSH